MISKKGYQYENLEHLNNVFRKFDHDMDLELDFDEFERIAELTTPDFYDLDRNGTINTQEMDEYYTKIFGEKNQKFEESFFVIYDPNQDGLIGLDEFANLFRICAIFRPSVMKEVNTGIYFLKQKFNITDLNGDGMLSIYEMGEKYKNDYGQENPEYINDIFEKFDITGNSYLRFEEFEVFAVSTTAEDIDLNGDSVLDVIEFARWYKNLYGTTNVLFLRNYFEKQDENGDGLVDFKEIIAILS